MAGAVSLDLHRPPSSNNAELQKWFLAVDHPKQNGQTPGLPRSSSRAYLHDTLEAAAMPTTRAQSTQLTMSLCWPSLWAMLCTTRRASVVTESTDLTRDDADSSFSRLAGGSGPARQ